eukprot:CAMPEP_0172194144 /NCGR_PEP_ID=MMETSP1050-20130122/25392_1 /TAXON_ID=233186 /ORGANISM="Cryptomonas curvata, Strain CCAP979/52" /LENGTH=148 /DNA_ID=CAMNT_0012869869 /DNA_START=231 /DNA_END=677 /DNA_ORIENTATION=-
MEQWNSKDGCTKSISTGSAWCKNYACAKTFPRCNDFGDSPLPICRQTCTDCLLTCDPDRPILPPGLFYGGESPVWADNLQGQAYDAMLKTYRCRADGSLVDGVKLGVLWYGAECTGAAPPRTAPRSVAVMAALLLALCVAVAAAAAGL